MATNNTSAIYLVTQERLSINWTFRGRLSEEKEFAEKNRQKLNDHHIYVLSYILESKCRLGYQSGSP